VGNGGSDDLYSYIVNNGSGGLPQLNNSYNTGGLNRFAIAAPAPVSTPGG